METSFKFLQALLLISMSAFLGSCGDEPTKDTGSGIYIIDGHKFVDLGLPSGLLWADRNVGASVTSAYGDYFAWGETNPKTEYSSDTYKYGSNPDYYTKYNSKDGKTTLDAADDAATANWGSRCRMPTFQDCQELTHKCKWTWQSSYFLSAGYLVTGPNGKSIFLPAAGYYATAYHDRDEEMTHGYYLLKDRYSKPVYFAYTIGFNPNEPDFSGAGFIKRHNGAPVRPVAERIDSDEEFDGNDNGNSGGSNSGNSGGSTGGGGSTSYEKPDIALEDFKTYPTKIKVNYRIYNQDKAKVTSAKIYYGTGSPSKSTSASVAGTLITTYISGLKKGTTYYVKCTATGKGGSATSYTTRITTDF